MPVISHASVPVDDQAKALAFYTDVLGFVVKHDVPLGDDRWLTVVSDEHLDGVELLLEPDHHPATQAYKAALVADGIPVTQFTVTDLDATHARLVEHGVEFTVPPTDMGAVRAAVLDDTCGNYLQLIEPI